MGVLFFSTFLDENLNLLLLHAWLFVNRGLIQVTINPYKYKNGENNSSSVSHKIANVATAVDERLSPLVEDSENEHSLNEE